MTKETQIALIAGGLVALVLFAGASYQEILKRFLMTWEGFEAQPYWDVKQWSWGYGTRVPNSVDNKYINPGGTITRSEAMQELLKHSSNDYTYLKPLVRVSLNANQWAAFLSFAYNTGKANADNLINNINNQDWQALGNQWNLYVYSGGLVNQHLVDRRAAEWHLFSS